MRRASHPIVALGVVVGFAAACARRGDPVATAVETQGTVQRNDGSADWKAADVGTAFFIGDSARTGADARARLRLNNGTVIRMVENAQIRFARGALPAAKAPDVKLELGSAEVEVATEETALVTALGVARIERGARVRVSSAGERTTLEVLVGRAVVLGAEGDLVITQGEGARIKVGEVRPERYRVVVGAPIVEEAAPEPAPAPPPAAPEPAPAPAAPEAPVAEDKPARGQSSRADVTLEAGETGTVHVSGRSLALRLSFDRLCSGDASVEVKGGSDKRTLTGSGALVMKLRPGNVRYRVRCAEDARGDKPRATGSLVIKHDSGDMPVSRRAAVNALDADGRRYTVLFQTRLPALTLGWAAAPAGAANLSLHVESSGSEKTLPCPTASHQMPSGALSEGSYTWWYVTTDGRSSPKTAVTIRFDNAAPTAQFFPKRSGGEPTAPGLVAVDGVTIDGAKVSAGGQSVPVDERGRFSATVAPANGDDAVMVRLEHPRTGVHYYVRQPGSRHRGRLAHAR